MTRARIEVQTAQAMVPVAVTVSPLRLPEDPAGAMVLVRDLRAEERAVRERLRLRGFTYVEVATIAHA